MIYALMLLVWGAVFYLAGVRLLYLGVGRNLHARYRAWRDAKAAPPESVILPEPLTMDQDEWLATDTTETYQEWLERARVAEDQRIAVRAETERRAKLQAELSKRYLDMAAQNKADKAALMQARVQAARGIAQPMSEHEAAVYQAMLATKQQKQLQSKTQAAYDRGLQNTTNGMGYLGPLPLSLSNGRRHYD